MQGQVFMHWQEGGSTFPLTPRIWGIKTSQCGFAGSVTEHSSEFWQKWWEGTGKGKGREVWERSNHTNSKDRERSHTLKWRLTQDVTNNRGRANDSKL